ncbi:hypothetical protein HGA91_00060 [candidate division WWE3 bacterium]|nr:hypothetical protein [candidate division WWE3 bacterium]
MTQSPDRPGLTEFMAWAALPDRGIARNHLDQAVFAFPVGDHVIEVHAIIFTDIFAFDGIDQSVYVLDQQERLVELTEGLIGGSRHDVRVGDRFCIHVKPVSHPTYIAGCERVK